MNNFLNFQIDFWTFWGLVGACAFFSRFIIQWIVSEKKKKSVIPVSFWYLSIVGSLILLVYSFQRNDLVFLLAMSLNTIVYIRNLMLLRNEKQIV
ncbi:lipid A biosynthesis protein [Candidatus Peregrinibacteria bacterium]|nr:lipid A biosynthesis protein [Candidatus Peregrinibacteria bacterium]